MKQINIYIQKSVHSSTCRCVVRVVHAHRHMHPQCLSTGVAGWVQAKDSASHGCAVLAGLDLIETYAAPGRTYVV